MFNNQLFFFLYSFAHQSHFLDMLIIFFAQVFPYVVIFLAVLFLIFHHDVITANNPFKAFVHKWKEILSVFFSGTIAWFLAVVLKTVVHAPRPFTVFPQVHALITEIDFSFPSGHATFFSALAVSLFFCHKKVGYCFMLFAFLIGIARIMAGVHFPGDIISGFILGTVVAIIVHKISEKQ